MEVWKIYLNDAEGSVITIKNVNDYEIQGDVKILFLMDEEDQILAGFPLKQIKFFTISYGVNGTLE